MGSSTPTADVGPREDTVLALLEYLVEPMLPLKSSIHVAPSISQQESVARQVHAVVLLYNFYHRKCHSELEYLDFISFCKLAVTLKPTLMVHMKFSQQFDESNVNISKDQLSLTEKAIMDACLLSKILLKASEDSISSKRWPIDKVAVLLVDSKKANCVLQFNSITNGVWSVIEKDLDYEDASVGYKRKRSNKNRPILMGDLDEDDEAWCQQVAFSAVKETTGINASDLKVLESHFVYSLSKEMRVAQFYIMQCDQSINEDLQVPIKDAIDSLQGPVVRKSSSRRNLASWITTPVVEYYHVLPYAEIMLDWFSRKDFPNEQLDCTGSGNIHVKRCQSSEKLFEKEVTESKEVPSPPLHKTPKVDSAAIGSIHVDKFQSSEELFEQEVTESKGIPSPLHRHLKVDCVDLENMNVDDMQSSEKLFEKEVTESRKVPPPPLHKNSKVDCADLGNINGDNIQSSEKVFEKEVTESKKVPSPLHKTSKVDSGGFENMFVDNCQSSEKLAEKEVIESVRITSPPLNKTLTADSELMHNNSFKTEDAKVVENGDRAYNNCFFADSNREQAVVVNISKSANLTGEEATNASHDSSELKADSKSDVSGMSNSSESHNMDVDKSPVVCTQKEKENKRFPTPLKVYHPQRRRNSSTNGIKVMAEASHLKKISENTEQRKEKVDLEQRACVDSPAPIGLPTTDCSLVIFEKSSKDVEKSQLALVAKGAEMSKCALRVLHGKRENLTNQLRIMEDEIAMIDRKIKAIVDGDENDVAIALEVIMDCCNEVCVKDKSQAPLGTNQHAADQRVALAVSENKVSQSVLTSRNPCQELDDICRTNKWTLPMYCVSATDGGYVANVSVKGSTFECSGGGEKRPSSRDARESAAIQMIMQLQHMPIQAM